ncbi:hypothetical protein I4U23_003920 [Adineta vaga]|nr:hypothetical protein I4U23_003920 [Adineta vaga]
MFVISNCNMLKFALALVLIVSVLGKKEEKKGDNLCPTVPNVLCVRDVLREILFSAGIVKNNANEIEQFILRYEPNEELLNSHIKSKSKTIESTLPKSKNHQQYTNLTSIAKIDLINLVQEEVNAFNYIYKSIENVLKQGNIFETSTERLFKQILTNIQENILCPYRSVLNVYSATPASINEVNGIEIAASKKKDLWSSFLYNVNSIITARLIQNWVDHTDNFISNLEKKFS